MASTSKEGSRRGKFSMSIRRRCDEKYQYRAFKNCDWNENNIKPLTRNNWRASLVKQTEVKKIFFLLLLAPEIGGPFKKTPSLTLKTISQVTVPRIV